jgi:hypothetical protein
MSRKSPLGPIIGVLVLALVIGGLIGWWASRNPTETQQPIVEAPEAVVEQPTISEKPEQPPVDTIAVDPETPMPPDEEPKLGEVNEENWQDHLSEILGAENVESDEKADKLATMIPKLSEPAQVELVGHLANLVSDEEYNKKTAGILISPHTPASVSDVLLTDLMNRHDGLRLPLVLEIAKVEDHPLKDQAREMLEMSLSEEFGTDWDKWKKAIDDSLREQGLAP